MKGNKGQVIFEYLVYFGLSIIFFVSIYLLIASYKSSVVLDDEYNALYEIGSNIQHSFFVMQTMTPEFRQTLTLPDRINGKDYAVEILASNLYITQGENEIILALPPVNGSVNGKVISVIVTENGVTVS